MKYLKVFEEETTKKPENLKELKKIMRKASNDFKGTGPYGRDFWGEFSLNMEKHRGQFMFANNPSKWDNDGQLTYTGSGNPDSYIANINKRFFNDLGWEMVDGPTQRTVTVKKLNMNEKEYYENPDNFEKLEQIDVYLGPMRKKLIIDVKGNKAEFTSKEVDELLNAITLAKSKM